MVPEQNVPGHDFGKSKKQIKKQIKNQIKNASRPRRRRTGSADQLSSLLGQLGGALGQLDLGGGVVGMSAKDIYTAPQLLEKAVERLRDRDDDDPARSQELLWELALKLRIDASQAQEVLCENCVGKMASVAAQDHHGGWSKVLAAVQGGDMELGKIALNQASLGVSVLHELCRYRSGCEALAKDGQALDKLTRVPLQKLQKAQLSYREIMTNGSGPGMLEQALVDMAGRCLNGLDKQPDLATAFCIRLKRELLLKGVEAGHHAFRFVGGDMRFLDLGPTVTRLRDLMKHHGDPAKKKFWRSTYCMERVAVHGFQDTLYPDAPGRTNVPSTTKNRTCRVCGKGGRVGVAVMICKRCKTAIYCSAECQRADWRSHKRECVPQKKAPAPGGFGDFLF